jgi:hypothetical protein
MNFFFDSRLIERKYITQNVINFSIYFPIQFIDKLINYLFLQTNLPVIYVLSTYHPYFGKVICTHRVIRRSPYVSQYGYVDKVYRHLQIYIYKENYQQREFII